MAVTTAVLRLVPLRRIAAPSRVAVPLWDAPRRARRNAARSRRAVLPPRPAATAPAAAPKAAARPRRAAVPRLPRSAVFRPNRSAVTPPVLRHITAASRRRRAASAASSTTSGGIAAATARTAARSRVAVFRPVPPPRAAIDRTSFRGTPQGTSYRVCFRSGKTSPGVKICDRLRPVPPGCS